MPTEIWVAVITGGLSLIGMIAANAYQSKQLRHDADKRSELADERLKAEIEKDRAVTNTKIDELTREVREHNGFARRVPVIEEQIKVANHRIEDLERKTGV